MHDRIEHLIEQQVSRGGHSSRARSKSEYVSRYVGSMCPLACLAVQWLPLQVLGQREMVLDSGMLSGNALWSFLFVERSLFLYSAFRGAEVPPVGGCGGERHWPGLGQDLSRRFSPQTPPGSFV